MFFTSSMLPTERIGSPDCRLSARISGTTSLVPPPLPGLAAVAVQEGAWAAQNIACDLKGEPRVPFRYADKGTLATIGRKAAVANFGRIHLSGVLAWITWLFVHILLLVGFRNRLMVLAEWAWSYFTPERSARLITGTAPCPAGGHQQP
jgi:NADH dehydrogenase